ncbi:stage V sporulation protein AE [Candidatus Epulonipiscium fishelsonii]|uniref:Stage V sporulation protein AE n=1 Tax=Candidatus Epulonipiscium fishelsonii TaxID=77094 RepID=A0ACC8X799_9FIRM|nr:stage V sporulation protein AE [Epulopiscium sp. SCG-B11WGA-EpuloA1]ONI41382.1 stage V sporulation protein AE [Epulopiscium sp. SCG-B05WGA-EpuloA1]ONI47149.1 stage V sporulation protein AE [Epulopiscium sp. SCG-C06WGA-EpuloA1]
MEYIKAFIVGGGICVIGQILLDRTKLTSGRIMVIFSVTGAFLTALGVYQPVVEFAGAGATVPILGFGYSLANGVIAEVKSEGLFGIMTGGLKATAGGISAAIAFGYLAALFSNPKSKG